MAVTPGLACARDRGGTSRYAGVRWYRAHLPVNGGRPDRGGKPLQAEPPGTATTAPSAASSARRTRAVAAGSSTPGDTLETTMTPAPAVSRRLLRRPRDAGDGPDHRLLLRPRDASDGPGDRLLRRPRDASNPGHRLLRRGPDREVRLGEGGDDVRAIRICHHLLGSVYLVPDIAGSGRPAATPARSAR